MEAAARGFREALERFATLPHPVAARFPLWPIARTSRSATIRGRAFAAGELRCRPGASADVELSVRNEGESRWISTPEPFGGHVAIGAEVEDLDANPLGCADPASLPCDLEPGAEAAVRLRFVAPPRSGEYRLRPILLHVGRGIRHAAGDAIALVVEGDGC